MKRVRAAAIQGSSGIRGSANILSERLGATHCNRMTEGRDGGRGKGHVVKLMCAAGLLF